MGYCSCLCRIAAGNLLEVGSFEHMRVRLRGEARNAVMHFDRAFLIVWIGSILCITHNSNRKWSKHQNMLRIRGSFMQLWNIQCIINLYWIWKSFLMTAEITSSTAACGVWGHPGSVWHGEAVGSKIFFVMRPCSPVLQNTENVNWTVLCLPAVTTDFFNSLRKAYSIEAIPVSQDNGVKYPGFLSASFIGPIPNDLAVIEMQNLCLLQLLK